MKTIYMVLVVVLTVALTYFVAKNDYSDFWGIPIGLGCGILFRQIHDRF